MENNLIETKRDLLAKFQIFGFNGKKGLTWESQMDLVANLKKALLVKSQFFGYNFVKMGEFEILTSFRVILKNSKFFLFNIEKVYFAKS